MMLVLLALACAPEPAPGKAAPEPGPAPQFYPRDTDDGAPLSDTVEAAIARAPAWLRDDLRLNLRRTASEERQEIAAVLVDLDEPWLVDEVAFAMAHTSPEMMEDRDFHPELFVDNARWIDAVAPELAYVELVDEGEADVDDDFWTTAVYQVEVDGALEAVTLDRDLYYWFVVHPRIEDEGAFYIDAWDACSSGSLECPSDPEAGMHWREFLWMGAAETCPDGGYCPVLQDAMGEVEFLWSDAGGGVGAVGAIASFLLQSDDEAGRWFTFGAHGERSIQPNRIYALGRGNCGEWGDMTTAAARTALIPNLNATPSSWDHTWNEFYDPISDRWVAWEPVNWWFDHGYGAPYANYGTRGDTGVFHITDRYLDAVGTLQVTVRDGGGLPVDGATVSLWSPYEEYWWYAGEAGTDPTGRASFSVAPDKQFAMRVEWDGFSEPPEDNRIAVVTDGVAAGETEDVSVELEELWIEGIEVSRELDPGEPVATLEIAGAVRATRTVTQSFRYDGHTSTAETMGVPARWFVTDEDNYERFKEGDDYDVLDQGRLAEGGSIDLDPALGWVVVIHNDHTLSSTIWPEASLTLTPGPAGDWVGEVAHTEAPMLRPNEYVVVRVYP